MKNRHPVSEARPPERLLPFWRGVRALMAALWAAFGGPEDIAARSFLSRADYAWIGQALRGVEAALRRLLFIQAAKMTLPSPRKKSPRAFTRPAIEEADLAKPETWRAGFRLVSAPSRPSRRASDPSEERVRPSLPLAMRFEAALRVFDAPEVYLRRAARLLRKTKAIAQRLCTIPRGVPDWAGAALIGDIVDFAAHENSALNSS